MNMKCERRQSKGKESKKITDLRKIKKKIQKTLGIQTEESERTLQTTKAADADKAYRRRKTRTKHAKNL